VIDAPATTTLLEARRLCVGYGGLPVVHDLDLDVGAGEIVVLLGANGAGKTTTLRAIAGALPVTSGEVLLRGRATKAPLHRRARAGVGLVTEERSVFMGLTAQANLRLGRGRVADALEMFPELHPLLGRRAGLLSGGEQQILTLARALAGRPWLLLADELSLGLAPLIVRRLLHAVRTAADGGIGVLLVEQHARQALAIADRGLVLRRGRIVMRGTARELRDNLDEIRHTYLSGAAVP
jgi:branched-chain amino acid transport system ATP-binding protein